MHSSMLHTMHTSTQVQSSPLLWCSLLSLMDKMTTNYKFIYVYACYPRAGFQSFVLGAHDLERPHQCTWHRTWRKFSRSWHHALHIHNTGWEFSDDKLIRNMRGLYLGNSILYSNFVDEKRENIKLHFCILNWTVVTCTRYERERERESQRFLESRGMNDTALIYY